jgi:hypothetical protein
MATTTRTTDDHDPVYIPTLDEIDRMAGLVRPASNELDPQARLARRIDAHRELVSRRDEANPQGVRR